MAGFTPPNHPFTSGELLLHHRAGAAGTPITCGVTHGCVTAVVEDVACWQCREVLSAAVSPEDSAGLNAAGGAA